MLPHNSTLIVASFAELTTNNDSLDVSQMPEKDSATYLFTGIVYTILSIVGVVGNCSLLYVVFSSPSKMSDFAPPELCGAINIGLVAFSDLLSSVLVGYYSIGQFKENPDFLGSLSCKLVSLCSGFCQLFVYFIK